MALHRSSFYRYLKFPPAAYPLQLRSRTVEAGFFSLLPPSSRRCWWYENIRWQGVGGRFCVTTRGTKEPLSLSFSLYPFGNFNWIESLNLSRRKKRKNKLKRREDNRYNVSGVALENRSIILDPWSSKLGAPPFTKHVIGISAYLPMAHELPGIMD